MLPRLLTGLLVLLTLFQLVACQDCGNRNEPLLTLTLQSKTPFRVDTLYGSGATGKLLHDAQQSGANQFYRLPLNLNADSTRYVLRIDGRQEAITVFYQRKFYYRSRQCGYVYDLLQPSQDYAGKPGQRGDRSGQSSTVKIRSTVLFCGLPGVTQGFN